MNRVKKEEQLKNQEARKGKSVDEIAAIDAQDIINEQINKISKSLHVSLFPEEYDYMSDSNVDIRNRNKGINPMSTGYIQKIDDKRRVLGFSLLSSSGYATDNETLDFCLNVAKEAFNKNDY